MDEWDSHCPCSPARETTARRTGLVEPAGKDDPVEHNSSLALWRDIRGVNGRPRGCITHAMAQTPVQSYWSFFPLPQWGGGMGEPQRALTSDAKCLAWPAPGTVSGGGSRAVDLSNRNTGVLRWAHGGQKPPAEQKIEASSWFSEQMLSMKAGPHDPSEFGF